MGIFNFENQIYLISNLFRIYVLYKFINIFLKKRSIDIKFEIVGFLLYFLINSILYLALNSPLVNSLNNIVVFFILTYLYEGEIKIRVFITILNFAIGMVLESGVYFTIINMNFPHSEIIMLTNIISILLHFIFVLILEKKMKYISEEVLENKYFISLLLIPLGSIFMYLTTISLTQGVSNTIKVINTLIILLINFLVFSLYTGILKSYRKDFDNRILKQQNNAYRNQFEIIKESQENIEILRHDTNNHIAALTTLTKENDNKKILEYLNRMNAAVKVDKEYIKTGNQDIDSIINYKIHEAKIHNIEVNTRINIPKEFNISSFDLIVILGNLIDNAIEALDKVKNKKLEIELTFRKGAFYINITNDFNGDVVKRNNILESTKKNKEFHGLGFKSVKKLVDKYNGTIRINYMKSKFVVEIILFN